MPRTLALAWRNLARNRRRTLTSATALTIGLGLSVAGYGFMEGMAASLVGTLTHTDLGHVQIHAAGYTLTRRPADVISDSAALVGVVRTVPDVVGASPRLYGYALASRGNGATATELVGIDPAEESRVTDLPRFVNAGQFLPNDPTPWPRGRSLTDRERELDSALTRHAREMALAEIEALAGGPARSRDDTTAATTRAAELARTQAPPPARPVPVVLGADAAATLRAQPGESLHLSTTGLDGTIQDLDTTVTGLIKTGTPGIDRRIYMHLADMQRFIQAENRAHEVAISTIDPSQAEIVAGHIAERLKDQGTLDVRGWASLRPDVVQLLEIGRGSAAFMVAVIFAAAGLGVLNTMLMAVHERTRELGVLKAIGMSARRVIHLMMTETLLLTAASATVGLLIGGVLQAYMAWRGVDLSPLTGGISLAGVSLSPTFHGRATVDGFVVPSALLSITALLAGLYPAWRASRLPPAVGMRDV